MNRYSDAVKSFQQSESLGVRGSKRAYAETYAAQRDYRDAEKVLRSQTSTGEAASDIVQRLSEITFPLDQATKLMAEEFGINAPAIALLICTYLYCMK